LKGIQLTQHGDYRIESHVPGIDDYLRLRQASGLSPFSREAAEKGLPNSIFGVCLMSGDTIIGMGRIIGDGGCFSGHRHRDHARTPGQGARQDDHGCTDGLYREPVAEDRLCQSDRRRPGKLPLPAVRFRRNHAAFGRDGKERCHQIEW